MPPEHRGSLQGSVWLWTVLSSDSDTDCGVRNKAIGLVLDMNVLRATHCTISALLLFPGWKLQQPTPRLQRVCFFMKKLLVAKQ